MNEQCPECKKGELQYKYYNKKHIKVCTKCSKFVEVTEEELKELKNGDK